MKAFVYSLPKEHDFLWKDGLWAALQTLDFQMINLQKTQEIPECEYVLAWGGFQSHAEKFVRDLKHKDSKLKIGLCIGGNATIPYTIGDWDILFYETDWYRPQISAHPNIVKAFGVNTDIFKPIKTEKIWDCITVGAFANWKRLHLLKKKRGYRLAVGDIQKGNTEESMAIVNDLLSDGVCISDMVDQYTLAKIYNSAKKVYVPAQIIGGGERTVWEAKACGVEVECEPDNPKLQELIDSPVKDHLYYAEQLKKWK
jgi:hypothetical protein